jgi:hypothetical protein
LSLSGRIPQSLSIRAASNNSFHVLPSGGKRKRAGVGRFLNQTFCLIVDSGDLSPFSTPDSNSLTIGSSLYGRGALPLSRCNLRQSRDELPSEIPRMLKSGIHPIGWGLADTVVCRLTLGADVSTNAEECVLRMKAKEKNDEFARWWAYWMSKVPPRPYATVGCESRDRFLRMDAIAASRRETRTPLWSSNGSHVRQE